jgi:hypothetical protein
MSANELTAETLLRAHAPHAPEALRQRVLALEPARRPARRFALVAVAGATVVALGAALVHGLADSGSQRAARTGAAKTFGGTVTTPNWEAAPTPAHVRQLTPTIQDSASSGAARVAAAPAGRLQHTDASIAISVPNDDELARATTRATRIATSLGGYAQSVHYTSRVDSVLDLRVPSQNVQTALSRLASLGTLASQTISTTDLQQRLRTQSDEIAQLRRRIAALHTALAQSSLPDAQRVILQIRLAESKRALSQRLHARKGTIAAGTMAQVSVEIGTKKSIAPVPHRGRIGRMLHSAVGFLALEGVIALFALIVASPFALVAGAVWLRRRRSVDRLLAA